MVNDSEYRQRRHNVEPGGTT